MVQPPGVNTPQFTWNLNKMPTHPIPVPPTFQPELPAAAIRFLADHPRLTCGSDSRPRTQFSMSGWRRN
jgi:hypothetical protein